jgi:hypothetical protein
VFASSALRAPYSALKTAPSAIRSPPSANCSAHPRSEPRGSQIDPVVREPFPAIRDLFPAVREAVRGQNSTNWGFREAENACFLKARRGFYRGKQNDFLGAETRWQCPYYLLLNLLGVSQIYLPAKWNLESKFKPLL